MEIARKRYKMIPLPQSGENTAVFMAKYDHNCNLMETKK